LFCNIDERVIERQTVMSGAGQREKDIKRSTFLNFKESRESFGGLRKLFDKIDDSKTFSVLTNERMEFEN